VRRASIVALVTTFAVSRSVHADLRVERADGAGACPDAASFTNLVRAGGSEPPAGPGTITVRFEHTSSGYRSRIVMPDGKHRTLADDASSCDGLAEATVLAVKLALDLETATPAVPADVVPPADVAVLDPEPLVVRRATPRAEIWTSGVLAFGIGSPVAPGVRAGASLLLGQARWSLGITSLVLPSQTRDIGEGKVDVSILGGGIEGCGRSRVGRALLLALCSRVEAMRLEGSARGFARTEEHARPLFAGTLLGRAQAKVAGPVALFIEAGAVVPFVRERFAIDTVGVVYDPPTVAAATGIGMLVNFE
jgi:hypothetical protein